MKQYLIYGVFLLSVLLGALPLQAQQNQGPDQVELRSGEIINGTIVEYRPDNYVKVAMQDGSVKTYLIEAVVQVRQGVGVAVMEEIVPSPNGTEDDPALNTILMKDGTTYQGAIAEYQKGELVRVRLEDGTLLELQEKDIEQMVYEGEPLVQAKPSPKTKGWEKATYEFRERGYFNTTSFAFSFGKRATSDEPIFNPFGPTFESEKTAIGFNIQHITGFQFNRMLGLGLGLSYDAYDLEEGESILTIFSHYRGYLTKTIVSPFIGVNAGYGFAFINEDQGITEAEGGWMVHPELGVRLGASDKTNFTLTMGYRMQKAYYTQELPFNGDIQYRDLIYRRFMFSLGLLF